MVFSLFMLTLSGLGYSQQYTPVDEGSSVQFKIKNLGFNSGGSFSGLKGIIFFDPEDLSKSKFEVTLDASSVNTDNNMRDNHLREESYFDVKNYPLIRFVSTKVTLSNRKGVYFIFGKLSIKNKTAEISFPFTATLSTSGCLFEGEFNINRRDFEVGGSSTLSDKVVVSLHVLSKK